MALLAPSDNSLRRLQIAPCSRVNAWVVRNYLNCLLPSRHHERKQEQAKLHPLRGDIFESVNLQLDQE